MPRPRVHPDKRARAAKACVPCKNSKKRCDADLPCSLCVTKGRSVLCQYPLSSSMPTTSPRRISQWASENSSDRVSRNLESPNPARLRTGLHSSVEGNIDQPSQEVLAAPAQHPRQLSNTWTPSERTITPTSTRDNTRESSPCQRSTMLRNSQGEQGQGSPSLFEVIFIKKNYKKSHCLVHKEVVTQKKLIHLIVYIGNIAAISFLHFLQTTLKRYIGTSIFTERHESTVVLEVETSRDNGLFEDDLSIAEKQSLIGCLWEW